MKHIISISLGSSSRDHTVETDLWGESIRLQRIGTDGDPALFRQKLQELDGKVDAFGIGGADLGINVNGRYYPLHSVQKLVTGIQTPMVDGGAVRALVEGQMAHHLEQLLPIQPEPKRVLIGTAVARYDMAVSFHEAGYEAIYGDFAFALGIPIAVRTFPSVKRLARLLLPVLSHLPLSVIYPTGDAQTKITPKYGDWYQWATVIADDFHYLKQFLPDDLTGKIVVTNTTTADDLVLLRQRGVSYLITTTPRLNGRSFGTNVIEAALVAISGKKRPLSPTEIDQLVGSQKLIPTIEKLN